MGEGKGLAGSVAPCGSVWGSGLAAPRIHSQICRPRSYSTVPVSHSTPIFLPCSSPCPPALTPTSVCTTSSHVAPRATSGILARHLARFSASHRTQHRSPHTPRHRLPPLQSPFLPSTPHELSHMHHFQHITTHYKLKTPHSTTSLRTIPRPRAQPRLVPVEFLHCSTLSAMQKSAPVGALQSFSCSTSGMHCTQII